MNPIKTGCFGCKYNYNWRCIKESICTGTVPYETYTPNKSEPSYIPANTSIMPEELEINGVKYRRIEND